MKRFMSAVLFVLPAFLFIVSLAGCADAQTTQAGVTSTATPLSDTAEGTAAIIVPPQKLGQAQRLLIIFPGMYKSALEYENLARELQHASPYSLWVGIINFTANLDNPPQAAHAVDYIFKQVRSHGFTDATPELTTVAGHSLGGIIAQYYVNGKNFAGLILMSSYLVRSEGSSSLPQATLPVFTLSGELDGQTRITRVAIDAKSLITLPAEISKKPVVVIPKVNHSQFAGTERAKTDLAAEIEYGEAQRQIARLMSDFIVINDPASQNNNDKQPATERLLSAVQTTREKLAPYWDAQEKDKSWCAEVQRDEAASLSPTLPISINHIIYENDFSFAQSKPQAILTPNSGGVQLTIGSRFAYQSNIIDRSTIPEAAQTIACKNKSAEALKELTGQQIASTLSCQDHNTKVYQWALSQLTVEARERFLRRGRILKFAADREVGSGLQWLPSQLSFELDPMERSAVVTSTRLSTKPDAPFGLGGMKYCKLLSPTRAMEWMMVDGLRD